MKEGGLKRVKTFVFITVESGKANKVEKRHARKIIALRL